MELLQYWYIIRKRLWLIWVFEILALIGAGYYILSQPPQYRTNTTLAISPSALNSAVNYEVANQLVPLANTYTEFMKTRSFAQLVKEKLMEQELPLQPTEAEVQQAIVTQYVQNTQLFRITATYWDPVVAKALADTTAVMLINANMERTRAEHAALIEAQLDTNRVQERDRLVELNNVLSEELTFYEDQIKLIEQQIIVLRNGPQSSDSEARLFALREELLNFRGERVRMLSSLADAQKSLLEETQRANAQVDTVVVVEEALLPTQALPRNILQPILAALAAALAVAVALAYGIEYLDYTVKTPEELDALYGIPTQAVIGYVHEATNTNDRTESLIMVNSPRSPIAEAIRSLRTSVRMAGIKQPIRSLIVTSGGPGEGKTFVTTNLAISIAQAGKRVILVDLDLRRPQVHKRFAIESTPGFTNLIVERDELKLADVLRPTMVPNLKILPCGDIPPNPSELLGSDQALELMQQLGNAADIVIYDTPPAATVTDAVLLAPLVDGVIQVVNANGPRIDMVLRTKDFLERSGARIIGPVLNRVALSDLGYYGNYYYYGSYYNSDHEKQRRTKRRWFWQREEQKKKRRKKNAEAIYEVESKFTTQELPRSPAGNPLSNRLNGQRAITNSNGVAHLNGDAPEAPPTRAYEL